MDPFKKIVRVGTVPRGFNGRRIDLFLRIEYNGVRLSISGVEGPRSTGNCEGGCGQVDMHYAHRNPTDDDTRYDVLTTPSEIVFADGWDADTWLDFLYVWKRWHLNDTKSECEHQEALGWKYATHAGRACPECGYVIGTEWKARTLPPVVLTFVQSLPHADKDPAWV